jgi:hypothetical protein
MRDFETRQEEITGMRKVRILGGSVSHDIPPGTLAEVLDDVRSGHRYEVALSRFLVEFHSDKYPSIQRSRIEDEPHLTPDPVLNALFGAAGEHLACRWNLGEAPAWTMRPERSLDRPLFLNLDVAKGDLFEQSPPAFRRRRIFTIAEPLTCSKSTLDLWTFDFVENDQQPQMRL